MINWTEELQQKLTRLWLNGLSCSQIAIQLGNGVSRSAVIGKVHRLGLPKRAEPNRTYTKQQQRKKAAERALISKPKYSEPKLKPLGPSRQRPPMHIERPNAVAFIDRAPDQCAMFLEGEDGANGFVCGEVKVIGSWCADCAKLCYQPTLPKRAA
jgi:hypothetical protein